MEQHACAKSCADVANSGFLHVAVVAVKGEATGSTRLVAFLGLDTPTGPPNSSQMVLPEKRKGVEGRDEK